MTMTINTKTVYEITLDGNRYPDFEIVERDGDLVLYGCDLDKVQIMTCPATPTAIDELTALIDRNADDRWLFAQHIAEDRYGNYEKWNAYDRLSFMRDYYYDDDKSVTHHYINTDGDDVTIEYSPVSFCPPYGAVLGTITTRFRNGAVRTERVYEDFATEEVYADHLPGLRSRAI